MVAANLPSCPCSAFKRAFGAVNHRYMRHARRVYSSLAQDHVIFSGIQPTGVPHLGNYLGALQQWTRMQNEATSSAKLLFSIVDLHAVTTRQNADQLRRWKRETLATLLAMGLNPDRSIIFYQSEVWPLAMATALRSNDD